jgi:hypothetical protein
LSAREAHPLGIPPVFLKNALQGDRARSVEASSAPGALLAEYIDASGYAFAWGQIIETCVTPFHTWRIVPVALWERLVDRREIMPLDIPSLLIRLAPIVRTSLLARLPTGVRLAGIQTNGRRHRHALFTLLLTEPSGHRRVRRWLQRRLLPELLPDLLIRCERALEKRLDRDRGQIARADAREEGARSDA